MNFEEKKKERIVYVELDYWPKAMRTAILDMSE